MSSTMRFDTNLSLLNHPIEEPSAFTPEALISAVRAERTLAPVPVLPVCLLEFDGDLTDSLAWSRQTLGRLGLFSHNDVGDSVRT
jgi:hypothetical protein